MNSRRRVGSPRMRRPRRCWYGQKIHLRRPAPSRGLLMVITQEPIKSLAALHRLLATNVRIPRKQQDIALPLMIPFSMEMLDTFAQCSPQRALSKQYEARE
jgi:hypothetical protein